MGPELNLPRDITRKIVNAAFGLCMADGAMARDASMKLLGEAFTEANVFAEKLGRDGMRLCLRCDRPVDKDGIVHPLGSGGQICAAYGHVFDEAEPKPSPWANAGKLIDAAELAGKVGTFEDLVKLCLDESTDTSFYAISEGDSVFCFSDDSICGLAERVEEVAALRAEVERLGPLATRAHELETERDMARAAHEATLRDGTERDALRKKLAETEAELVELREAAAADRETYAASEGLRAAMQQGATFDPRHVERVFDDERSNHRRLQAALSRTAPLTSRIVAEAERRGVRRMADAVLAWCEPRTGECDRLPALPSDVQDALVSSATAMIASATQKTEALRAVEFEDMVKRLEDASREHERLDFERGELAKANEELTERSTKVETAYAILRDAAQDFVKHIIQRMGADLDAIPVPDRVWIALHQHALAEPWPTGTNYIVERAEVEGGMHVQRLHQRVAKAEHDARWLRQLIDTPDPAPCRNCGRTVLAGPACCEKPDIPPYETPIADLVARVEAAEERAAKLASDLMMEKLRREGVERDLERVSRGEDDEEVIAHDSAEIGALKVELAQTKELLAGLTPVGKTFVSCTGTPGSDGRCQECGQMVANSAGTHMRLVGGE
jgi:hypothetical protein